MFYYANNGLIFKSQIEARDYIDSTGNNNVFINYYDEIFDKLDWKVEPSLPLPLLYKLQAQKIRDEYDYVVLLYSGGYDSTNILETFYYNNIKLDKIVVTGAFSKDTTTNQDQNCNGEIYKNAFPYLNELGLDNIVQVIDYSEMYGDLSNFSISQYGDNWIEHIGSRFGVHLFFWRDLDRHVVPIAAQNKKIAFIWGTDRPSLEHDTEKNEIFFRFRDTAITSYGRFEQPFKHNVNNINFYWDPTFPLILLKQLHIIKRYFLEHRENKKFPDVVWRSDWRKGEKVKDIDIINLIYNFRKPILHKGPKSKLPHVALRDAFFYSDIYKETDLYKFYQMGVNRLVQYRSPSIFTTKKYLIHKL